VGSIVYVIVRPPEFLDEVYLRNLEIQAAEERLRQLEARSGGLRPDTARLQQLEHELEREKARRQELERTMSSSRRGRRTAGATTELPAAERPPGY
jgi:predicted  nucleic acid-binding Zn-ribbon protein